MSSQKGQHGSLQDMYPSIWATYKHTYSKAAVSPEVWGFLHDLHLLQYAQDEDAIDDAAWAVSVLVAASRKRESNQSAQLAKALIRALPTKEHEAWYKQCTEEEYITDIVATHPRLQSAIREPRHAARTALAVGVMLQDFQSRWQTLLTWQQEFVRKEVGSRLGEVFREAQQVAAVMDKESFSFMLAKQLIRAGDCALALKLVHATPTSELAAAVECGIPARQHSYYELYTQLLAYGDAADLFGLLDHFVRVGAYSDASLAIYLAHEDLKEVVSFLIHFVSCVRRQQFGLNEDDVDLEFESRRSCCSIFSRKPKAPAMMPLRTSNVPHVVLTTLLDKYEAQDDGGKERLLHDKTFQQAFEVVLLLSESDLIVRMADRLTVTQQHNLKTCLKEWSRLHFLRILERNRPPGFDANAPGVLRLIAGNELWMWTASERRSHYFKSAARSSEDVAVVLCMFFELGMFLDPLIVKQLITDGQARSPPLHILVSFLPEGSSLFEAIAGEVGRHTIGLIPSEAKLLMRSPGFYDPGIQSFLRSRSVEGSRAIFRGESLGFARLLQVIAKLSNFKNGKMDMQALESSLGQIGAAVHGDSTCSELVLKLIDATLKKDEWEFLHVGADDLEQDPSAFTVASLASCAKRLREACETVRNQTVQVTFHRVVDAFLDTPPRGWMPLFNSLETVLFFLRFMEREDLGLAYEKFEQENVESFGEDRNMRKLLERVKKYYKEPFIDVEKDVTELCNLDLRKKMSKKLLPAKKREGGLQVEKFDNSDWNIVVEIALCAAESMKEKYNVPMLPHHTQMITLLMFAIQVCQGPGGGNVPKTILAKVGTGEGKSWIIGMLAAFVAKRGLSAHVVIDNDTLLERDYATMSALFKKLKLSADKRALDQGHQIVYCSAMDIELHCMRSMQACSKDASMKNCVMIVDEVDSLIVDENVYTCYVDYYHAGCEVSEWWWYQGRYEDPYRQPPWKRKLMEKLVSAERELSTKHEGRHFVADSNLGTFWALDERTCHVKRAAWFLWLELLRKKRIQNYVIRYNTRQSIICKQSCFSSYSYIFGLTGSLGTDAERRYTRKHFNASVFMVPNFLDTCIGQSRPRPRCLMTCVEGTAEKQLERTVATARQYCNSVPILVVSKDPERVVNVVNALRAALPVHALGDRLGPGVVELLDKPGQEGEFQQMVEVATQPLEQADKEAARRWRVTVTTAVGARGQDYHISDELVDEKGGFLLVLEYVPDSEREWIQFLGRTARHDHPGQYAVILNVEEYRHVFGFDGADVDKAVVKPILEHANKKNEQKLKDSEIQIQRGVLMHRYTRQWWLWAKENHTGDPEEFQNRFSQWVELCEKFETESPEDIASKFADLDLVTAAALDADDESLEHPSNDFDHPAVEPDTNRSVGRDNKEDQSVRNRGDSRRPTERKDRETNRSDASRKERDDTSRSDTSPLPNLKALTETPRSVMRRRHGEGRRILPDGRLFVGQFVHGKMSGEGQMKWPDGRAYQGQFEDDNMAGTGSLRWPDGRTYVGQWVRGQQHGQGTFTDSQGRAWTGQWKEGKRVDNPS